MRIKIISIGVFMILAVSIVLNFYFYFEIESKEKFYINELNSQFEIYESSIESALEEKEDYRIQASVAEYELNNIKERQKIQIKDKSNNLTYQALKSLDLRAFQTSGSAVIERIGKGEKFVVINSFFSENWEIEYNGKRGWISVREDVYNEYGMRTGEYRTIVSKIN